MSHCLCENYPEYPPDTALRTSVIVYLIPQHFSWFKNDKLFFVSNDKFPASFASAKTISAFFGSTGSTAHDEDGGQEQRTHLISFLVAQIGLKTS